MLSEAGFDYETVFYRMTQEEILEANAALDMQIEARNRQIAAQQAEAEMRRRMGRR
ncbi:hypothetical protein [uncultured Ruminococcus sp.]|uniref:hypothetical protein n=1 Tax=uncultured Ruminococcus sp. TaxID=165186 RepID=UPI0025FFA739|nr:hypothetical protein [uncultured Ruminococcus sp.]